MNQKLNVTSLSKQVYDHLLKQMNNGAFLPGSTINISKFSDQLGVSKTPLRDALIHLELEGFVTILPRRGVKVNVLTIQDVKNAYQLIGSLEAAVVKQCFELITDSHIAKLEYLNGKMLEQIEANNFKNYFESNLGFHNVFMNLSDNDLIKKTILPVKQRLYEFPTKVYINKWERSNCKEHQKFIDCLKMKDPTGAASILQDIHWSYTVQEKYILEFHTMREEMIDKEQASREKT